MNGTFSVLISGVGGQGIVMLSKVLGTACVASRIPVVTGEQHGLSQRSGSVTIHFRMGAGISSPLIPAGMGDCIVSLEALEALRYIEYLRPGGVVFTSTLVLQPVTRTAEKADTPSIRYMTSEDVVSRLRTVAGSVVAIDARKLSSDAGSPQTENILMLGALSTAEGFPVGPEAIESAIADVVPRAKDLNVDVFRIGRSLGPDPAEVKAGSKP